MTTFVHTDADDDFLEISPAPKTGIAFAVEGALVRTYDNDPGSLGVFVAKEDAPEVALAILRAAGYGDCSHSGPVESALASLASIGKKKEAAAKLDADALELLNAGVRRMGGITLDSLDDVQDEIAEGWRAVVKAARKIAATA
jgi:hypothetical protein